MVLGRVIFENETPGYVEDIDRVTFAAKINGRSIVIEATADTVRFAKTKAEESTRAGKPMTGIGALEEAATRWFWRHGMPHVPGIRIGVSELFE